MLYIEYQYLPPISVIKTSLQGTHIIISAYDKFQKMSFRNRCVIPTANGACILTVPIIGGRENSLPIKEIRIDNSKDWQKRHWRTIMSVYGRSPWFEHYADGLEKFYSRNFTFLCDLDLALLQWIYTCLNVSMEIEILENKIEKGTESSFLDLRNKILPKNFQDFEHIKNLPVYLQVFQEKTGFQPNMSIIDLFFCEGRNAGRCLR